MIRSSITFVAWSNHVYAEVILPLAVPGTFTYSIPEGCEVVAGMRVAVPFGRGRKLYGAVVRRVHGDDPLNRKARPILSVLDPAPIVLPEQLELWDRIAAYYMCTVGEVMIAALPGQLTLSSETRLVAGPHVEDNLPGQERAVFLLNALEDGQVVTLEQAGELLGLKDPLPVVKRLMEQGALLLEEQLKQDWKPRMATYIRLAPEATSEAALHGWFDRLEKAPKQLHVLMRFVELSQCLSDRPKEVERAKLVHASGSTTAVVEQLVKKGLFERYEREEGHPDPSADPTLATGCCAAHHPAMAVGADISDVWKSDGRWAGAGGPEPAPLPPPQRLAHGGVHRTLPPFRREPEPSGSDSLDQTAHPQLRQAAADLVATGAELGLRTSRPSERVGARAPGVVIRTSATLHVRRSGLRVAHRRAFPLSGGTGHPGHDPHLPYTMFLRPTYSVIREALGAHHGSARYAR